MGKATSTKKSSSKQQEVDWDATFKANPDLEAMATATKIWPASTTKVEALEQLHEQCLMPEQSVAGWEPAGEHRVPALREG